MNNDEQRLLDAVSVLKAGGTIRLGDVRLGVGEAGGLTVTGWTRFLNLENVTKSSALSELIEIKAIFESMRAMCSELAAFADPKKVTYFLGFDYGNGAIGICKEVDGAVIWEMNVQANQ
jgi:hypothetical protein